MVYDASIGFDPNDPTSSPAGRQWLASFGANTLGMSDPQAQQTAALYAMLWPGSDQNQTINQALAAAAANNQFNQGIASGQLKNQSTQIANTNAYQQGLLANARAQLAQQAQQFEQTYGLQAGTLLGTFNGQPTLANLAQQAQFLGTYNGNPTLQAKNQEQTYGLNLAALSGQLPNGGGQTLAGQQQGFNQWLANQQNAQAIGALTGEYGGNPTLAARAQQAAQQQAQAQIGLNTLQLGASLGGPADWLNYEEAASGARNNPLLAQGVASWADMTNNRPTGTAGWAGGAPVARSLDTLSADFGGPGSQGAYGRSTDQPMYAGGSASFNEQGGGSNVTPMYGTTGTGGYQPNKQATADYLANIGMNTNQVAPGWYQSLNPDQQQMAMGAWSKSGQSPQTVLTNLARNGISQGWAA